MGEYNIFEGQEIRGGPQVVLSRGQVVFENETLSAQSGSGCFIPRKPFSDYAYQRIRMRNKVPPPHIPTAHLVYSHLAPHTHPTAVF